MLGLTLEICVANWGTIAASSSIDIAASSQRLFMSLSTPPAIIGMKMADMRANLHRYSVGIIGMFIMIDVIERERIKLPSALFLDLR